MKPSNSLRPKESFGEKDWDKEKASPKGGGGGGAEGGLDEIKPPPASSRFLFLAPVPLPTDLAEGNACNAG